jgi:hypothetical protein
MAAHLQAVFTLSDHGIQSHMVEAFYADRR